MKVFYLDPFENQFLKWIRIRYFCVPGQAVYTFSDPVGTLALGPQWLKARLVHLWSKALESGGVGLWHVATYL